MQQVTHRILYHLSVVALYTLDSELEMLEIFWYDCGKIKWTDEEECSSITCKYGSYTSTVGSKLVETARHANNCSLC